MTQRWTQEQHEIKSVEDINAEALCDLNAEENAISTWYVGDKTEEELKKAVSALTSGFRSLDSIEIVFIKENVLETAGFNIVKNDGDTKIKDLSNLHRDIIQLKSRQLLVLAEIVQQSVWEGEKQIINTEQISLWLLQQMNHGKLKFDDLNKGFKEGFAGKVKKLIKKKKVVLEELTPELQNDLNSYWKLQTRKTTCDYELECPRYGHVAS